MKNKYVTLFMMNPGKVILGFLILLVSGISNAQETAISGKVSDENGVGLPGVGVLIKGTSTGMATDVEGNYKLNASPDDILVFSFVGYLSEEIAVGSQTIINVQLIPDLTQLEEIIVIGYGETKKRDLTGSVSSAPMEDMSYAPVASFDGALAGRVAGVQITSSQGRPGAPSVVKIRGNGSLTQSSTPLYVIDGFPIEDFDVTSIDQSDIESIEVLKGPSAVAIYGSRGGNGVILITSKTGVEGKVQVSYNGFYGIEEITKRVNVLSPYDFVDLRYEVDSLSAVDMYGPIELYQNSDGSSIGGIDWQDEVFDQTNVMSNTLSVNGGTKDTKYNISVSRYEAGGLLENSGFERNYATVNLDQRLSEKLRAGVNVSYTSALITGTHTSTNILNPDVDGGGSSSSRFNLLKDIVQGRPTGGLFISNEELLTLPEDPDTEEGAPITNPLVNAKTQIREDRRNTLLFNGYLKYTIIEGLDLRVSGGIQRLDRRRDAFDEVNSAFERRNGFDRGSIISSERNNTLFSSTLTYKKEFDTRSDFTGMVGFDYQNIVERSVTASSSVFPQPNNGVDNLGSGTQPGFPDSYKSPTNRLISYFGRVNYTYDDRYLATVTLRYDGSSKFGANNKFGFFPSAAVGWRFSSEQFLSNSKVITDGKLRAEWGQVGNNRIPAFVSTALLSSTTYGLENGVTPGVRPSNLANPDIMWETQEQINVGLDLGTLRNRLNFTFDVYRKDSKDLLLRAPTPSSVGFTSVFRNVGEIRNEGIELAINSVNIDKGLKWTSDFNITLPRTKTLALVESDTLFSNSSWNTSNVAQDPYANDYITIVGQPFGQMYGFMHDGLYGSEDFDENGDPFISVVFSDVKPGYRKYVDVNGDSVINDDDKVIIGNPNPKFYGGFNNTLLYKGFDLNIFFQWSYGNKIYNANRILWTSRLSSQRNFSSEVINRWRADNTEEQNSRATFRTIDDVSEKLTDKFVEDGSYLRLRTISLGYSLPKKILDKIRAQKLRIYVTGQNLWTWTNYTGYDPEVDTRGGGLTSGVDFGAYPRSRTFIGGISVTF